MNKSILLVGVGGQGTILASKLLLHGLFEAGYDVKMSEIHGMSQRGGSVSSHIRFGEDVASPVIEIGGADILIAFEKMEGMRWLKYVKPSGKVVVNDYEIDSMPILTGQCSYPKGINETINSIENSMIVDATHKANKLGNAKVMNVIMLGIVVKSMGLENLQWDKIIEENIKTRFIEINKKAFTEGLEMVVTA